MEWTLSSRTKEIKKLEACSATKLLSQVLLKENIQWELATWLSLWMSNSSKSMSKAGKETSKYSPVSSYCLKYFNKRSISPRNIKNIFQADSWKKSTSVKITNTIQSSLLKKTSFKKCKRKWVSLRLRSFFKTSKTFRKVPRILKKLKTNLDPKSISSIKSLWKIIHFGLKKIVTTFPLRLYF